MNRGAFERLLEAARHAHARHEALRDFCAFPSDLRPQTVTPHHIPPADLLAAETGLSGGACVELCEASIAAGPQAAWRETYKGTGIGADFLSRFGCYCLIGRGGAYSSAEMSAFVVYMPAGLDYPWHHHPAEELYFVLAGEAEFRREGERPETLRSGDTSFHASMQPHAMLTRGHPVIAYVLWRNHFEAPPVLTEREVTA